MYIWNLYFFVANGKAVDATQELIAIGVSNIGNSFMQAFPGTGSLSRSAVNNASGVRTPLGGVYTGEFHLYITFINQILQFSLLSIERKIERTNKDHR